MTVGPLPGSDGRGDRTESGETTMHEQDVQNETITSEFRAREEAEVAEPAVTGVDSTWKPRSWFAEIGRWRADVVK
ncbi:hypothetical protein SAMN04487904_101323 [Actinopolyspora lacussalsi subsp. righensis]|uniref:Uncharacterized protein n=1 Tax=Actinopolyspora righensis TaxID=995060 RepID=A0A1I6X7U8_9ACTN|nr:hypothetical protein [Actinopolyspora righensis]SFT34458.1 hypothetical protein SAMN04487904_101323 [Actinopolyspora righensis]